MIDTYSNEGDNILDITCYDAITGHECKNKKRNYTGIDLNPVAFEDQKPSWTHEQVNA